MRFSIVHPYIYIYYEIYIYIVFSGSKGLFTVDRSMKGFDHHQSFLPTFQHRLRMNLPLSGIQMSST